MGLKPSARGALSKIFWAINLLFRYNVIAKRMEGLTVKFDLLVERLLVHGKDDGCGGGDG